MTPKLVPRFFSAMEGISPSLASRVAERLWFTPPRKVGQRTRAREASWLERLDPMTTSAAGEQLVGYSAGSGSSVLLVHGWGGRAAQLAAFAGPLAAAGFHVRAFDLPAHGSHPDRQTDLYAMAAAVSSLVDQMPAPVYVIAHSLGAGAVEVAASRNDHIAAGVYLAPGMEADFAIRAFAGMVGLGPRTEQELRRRFEQRFGVERWRAVETRPHPISDIPLLLIHDPQDAQTPYELAARFAAASPNVELQPAPDLGHTRILRDHTVISGVVSYLAAHRLEVGGTQLRSA